ncbi:uncharacterized protein SAMN05216323_105323 [Williamwhitmania taraxaci]|uniref:Radical SAM core domain-containing protein n=2 Tax=Williamwhitmania taraxaci TaxID=1640674 RepID=A0A1G6PQ23_9BACT|nr:uncharacterized protein SAMN05216323_105323 [Williamwhitmania taraxaci]
MSKFRLNKFTYFLEYNNDVICFNLVNKFFFVLNVENYLLLKKHEDDLDKLKSVKLNLFTAMKKIYVIVDEDEKEIDRVKLQYLTSVYRDSTYRFTIIPTLNCNFDCWYCYETKTKGSMHQDVQDNILRHITHKITNERISSIDLDWFGGEPLMCFDDVIFPLSQKISQLANNHNVKFSNQITTNGYLLSKTRIDKLAEIELNRFQITLDGNKENHQKVKKGKNTYAKTVSNINELCQNIEKLDLKLRINFSDENLASCVDIIADIPLENRKKIQVAFQRIWQLKNINDYYYDVDEVKKIFKQAGFRVDEYTTPQVQLCYADKLEQAIINYDGLVFKCTARDFVESNSDGCLNSEGMIDWNIKKLSRRLGHIKFDNPKCLSCDLLPVCYGPCSQKIVETDPGEFNRICNYQGLKQSVDEMLKRMYHEQIC